MGIYPFPPKDQSKEKTGQKKETMTGHNKEGEEKKRK